MRPGAVHCHVPADLMRLLALVRAASSSRPPSDTPTGWLSRGRALEVEHQLMDLLPTVVTGDPVAVGMVEATWPGQSADRFDELCMHPSPMVRRVAADHPNASEHARICAALMVTSTCSAVGVWAVASRQVVEVRV